MVKRRIVNLFWNCFGECEFEIVANEQAEIQKEVKKLNQ